MEKQIVKMVFGSHLYGLETEKSDMDFKGIYIPNSDDLILNRVKKSINKSTGSNNSKNSADDVDEEYFTLQYFVEMALKGEMIALDMLHCSDPKLVLQSTPEWWFLVSNRERFYTKNTKAYIGYLKRQVAKYCVKGSRLADIKRAVDCLDNFNPDMKISEVWNSLPEGDYLKKIQERRPGGNNYYEVNAKKYQDTNSIQYVIDALRKMYSSYGSRAKLAEENNGVDWKAVSHALRAGYQMLDILTKGSFEYPLDQTEFLKAVKLGEKDWNDVKPVLEELTERIEKKIETSTLPNEPDREFWDNWLLKVYKQHYFNILLG